VLIEVLSNKKYLVGGTLINIAESAEEKQDLKR
jgi:hypothetical protein